MKREDIKCILYLAIACLIGYNLVHILDCIRGKEGYGPGITILGAVDEEPQIPHWELMMNEIQDEGAEAEAAAVEAEAAAAEAEAAAAEAEAAAAEAEAAAAEAEANELCPQQFIDYSGWGGDPATNTSMTGWCNMNTDITISEPLWPNNGNDNMDDWCTDKNHISLREMNTTLEDDGSLPLQCSLGNVCSNNIGDCPV